MKSFRTSFLMVWLLCCGVKSHAQLRSTIQAGNWMDPSVWESGEIPYSTDTVFILHPITIYDSIQLNRVNVAHTLTVAVNGSIHLTGSITVESLGNVQILGSIIGYDGSNFVNSTPEQIHFKEGSLYEHRYSLSTGEPPLAVWDETSTLLISRLVINGSLNSMKWQQSFGNFIYDCPNQKEFVEMLGNVRHIRGNFIVRSTGGNSLRLSLDRTTPTYIIIEGDFIIEGNSEVWISRAATTHVHVLGDFIYQSTSNASSYITTTGNGSLRVDGNVLMDSRGQFRFASAGGGTGALICKGAFTQTSGSLAVEVGGYGVLEFSGEVLQHISLTQTLPSTINLKIDNAIGLTFDSNFSTLGDIQIDQGNVTLPPSVQLGGSCIVNNNAEVHASETTIVLQGDKGQTIALAGATARNLFVNKSINTTVTLLDTLRISNQLHIQSTQTTVNSNGFLLLRDDSAVLGIPSGSSIEGNVTVERIIPAERVYRYVSFPTAQSSVGDLQHYIPITGIFDNPSVSQSFVSTSPSLYHYQESLPAWEAFPNNGSSFQHVFELGRGYSLYVRDNQNPTYWKTTGVLNQGLIVLPLSYTPQEDLMSAGWNLVGNPYACAIHWDAQDGWIKQNINNGIAIRDNTLGIFRYWDDGVGSLEEGKIAKGQAFWIKASGRNPMLQVNEEAKIATLAPYYRESKQYENICIALHRETLLDNTFIRTKPVSSNDFNAHDFPKLSNDGWNIAVEKNGKPIAIATFPSFKNLQQIPISLTFKNNDPLPSHMYGMYTLQFSQTGYEGISIHLIDHFLKDTLWFSTPYTFEITDNPNTYKNRFSLLMIRSITATETSSQIGEDLDLFPNPSTGYVYAQDEGVLPTLEVYDMYGKQCFPFITKQGTLFTIDLQHYSSGVYYFRWVRQGRVFSKKIILTKNG